MGLDDLEAQKPGGGGKYVVDQTCVRAWKRLYPGPESGWEVRVLDEAEAKLLAPRYAAIRNHPKSEWVEVGAGASDLLRADLLSRYGGVWVDTSVCPFQALDAWLPAALDAREGLFIPRAFDHEAIRLVLAGGETRGALSDMPAAAMTGSELEQFEGCLYEPGRFGPLVKAAKPMSSWFMAAGEPHDPIIDAWVEILYRRLLEVLQGRNKGKKRYPYFVAHCSMTTARLRDAAVEERWQRIRASAAEHGLPDPTGLGSTPCECAHRTELGCDPDFAEAHCYFVKKAGKKDIRAYLLSPRYQEHLDRLVVAPAALAALSGAALDGAPGEPLDEVRTLAPYRNHGTAAHFRAALPCRPRMIDGKPFLFQSPAQPDHKAFVCLNEKVGSTTWKLALLRAGPHTKFHNLTVSPHGAPAKPTCGKYSKDVAVPRFMMVRNPYSRLLSGFMDKCVGTASDKLHVGLLPSGFAGHVCASIDDPVRAFPAFVAAVIDEDPDRLNGHFSLLSEHCHVDAGYDYYLPTEQTVHWYEPFVAALDLGEAVRTGWDLSTQWWRNDGSKCFYHPPGLRCDGAPLGTVRAGALSGDSFHATGSDARLGEFYTPELARAVSEWAKADLEEFGYPAWDGVDGAGYLRRISTPGRN